MIARLPGLFRSERLASDISAVTRVIVILVQTKLNTISHILPEIKSKKAEKIIPKY